MHLDFVNSIILNILMTPIKAIKMILIEAQSIYPALTAFPALTLQHKHKHIWMYKEMIRKEMHLNRVQSFF